MRGGEGGFPGVGYTSTVVCRIASCLGRLAYGLCAYIMIITTSTWNALVVGSIQLKESRTYMIDIVDEDESIVLGPRP